MPSPTLILGFLLSASFALATVLGVWREQSVHHQTRSGSVLEVLMGDSQRLFANHFITKADVYLHSGVYPSIFDQAERAKKSYLTKQADASLSTAHPATQTSKIGSADGPSLEQEDHDHHAETDAAHAGHAEHDDCEKASVASSKPRDWIDGFGRNFYPTKHVHLGEKGDPREILPWLRLAAELNPNQADIYPLAGYWLRQRMGKVKEAEQFLREGWRANPDSYEILFELGRLFEENYRDHFRARNLFTVALKKWDASETAKEQPDDFIQMQITGHLARLEEREGNLEKAIGYFERLAKISPHPEVIQQHVEELRAKL